MLKRLVCIVVSCILTVISINDLQVNALDVSAKACIMIEAVTGNIIYEKNSHDELPMASTTKIMTTILSLESGDLDTQFTVDSDAIKVEGSSMGLVEGDIVTKRALCYGMMLPSGNDSANATAIKLAGSFENFATMMNDKAKEIGMEDTLFVTPSGLDEGGHHSTAYDMALLTRYALKNSDFREICGSATAQVNFGNPPYDRWLKNSNKLLNMYEGVIGVKTGFTDDAGRCLVSACERNGVTLIVVTLNAPNDWEDHMSLYDYGFSQVSMQSPTNENFSVNVVGGKKDTISLERSTEIQLPNVTGYTADYKTKVYLNGFEYAPIEAGETLGYVEYSLDGEVVATSDLVSSEAVLEDTSPIELSFKEKLLKFIYQF
ncbi:MAG: D-alanyl-D-alanine carboxypeptidase [Ruminococcus sp.]|nr:D-alanyl-D-alanine carboxypeptidase [Ruminococcus sp.]MCD7800635.1 D-alanyl-D-alanine carboxypeptidase [Ruminococcus sp.]